MTGTDKSISLLCIHCTVELSKIYLTKLLLLVKNFFFFNYETFLFSEKTFLLHRCYIIILLFEIEQEYILYFNAIKSMTK